MTVQYFVDTDGNYLGAFEGTTPPSGAIEVPFPPDDSRQHWNGASWDPLPPGTLRVTKRTVAARLIAASEALVFMAALKDAPIAELHWHVNDDFPDNDVLLSAVLITAGSEPSRILAPE